MKLDLKKEVNKTTICLFFDLCMPRFEHTVEITLQVYK